MIKYLYDEIAKRWLDGCDSIWVISDTHFGDLESYKFRGIINCISKEQYDENVHLISYEKFTNALVKQADIELIKKINSKAGRNSCLIILGDVGNLECVKKLKAKRKILIMGNHDKGSSNYKRVVEHVTKCPMCGGTKLIPFGLIDNGVIEYKKQCSRCGFQSATFPIEDNHLFDEVYEGPLMINDRTILSHEPIAVPEYVFNIHGHVHNKNYKGDFNHLNVCAEAIDYTPINLLNLFKRGLLKDINSIHRVTIDIAKVRKIQSECIIK